MRIHAASDIRLNLDALAGPTFPGTGFLFLAGIAPWSALRQGPCPVCEGRPLKSRQYCLGCDRTGLDGKVTWPGLKVDQCPDPLWSATPTRYVPIEKGIGASTRRARRAARAARAMRAASMASGSQKR